METFTFPTEVVAYLNALWAGQPAGEAQQSLLAHLKTTASWLKEQSPLMVTEEEELAASQLRAIGRELALIVTSDKAARYDALEQVCEEYSMVLNCFIRLRSRLRFVDFCELDILMQWAVAVSQQRAPRTVLISHLNRAEQLMEGLQGQIEGCLPLLPAPVHQALDNGMRLVTQGLHGLSLQTGDLRRALLLIRKGCQLLSFFVRWRWQMTGWSSPFADNPVWRNLHQLTFDMEGRTLPQEALAELRSVAEIDRSTRLLPIRQGEVLWREWDLRLASLRPDSFDDLLQLVEEMHLQTLDIGQGFATFLENLILACSGAWRGTLPDSLLARELWALYPRAVDGVQAGLAAVQVYLDGGERQDLAVALEILLQCAQENRRPQAVLTGLRCRSCQQYFNPEDLNDRCLGHGVHQYLQVCA